MSSLHYDPYQFAGRRPKPVQAEYTPQGEWSSNGIAFEDFARMRQQPGSVSIRHERWQPSFAYSDAQLRNVLLHKGWSYVHNKHTTPTDDWQTVNTAATKKALGLLETGFKDCPKYKRAESSAHVAAVKQAGGYLELLAAIAYRAWRLGQDSIAIAEALHMSPQAVRVNLQRLCDVARELGYETFKRRHDTYRRARPKLAPKDIEQWFGRIIRWYKEGRNASQIAQAIGYPKGCGNNRVRKVLMDAGIYKSQAQRRRQRVN